VAAEAHDAPVPVTRWERLLDLDGDLADALGDDVAARARDRIGVATVRLATGSWWPQSVAPAVRDAFALLVCDGLIVRELELAGTVTADLIGPGDIVAFGTAGEPLLATRDRWHVSGEACVAILDNRVLPALHAWPALSSRLIERAARQAARAAQQRAISQLPRVELRIRALLWHLAERWGRVGASGVVVPLELTHTAVGRLVGARRSTVTLALGELSREGSVFRRADGAWVLRADSNPSAASIAVDATPGIATVNGGARAVPLRLVSAPAAAQAQSLDLAERIERLRNASAQQQARTLALLARCEATRARTLRGRSTRVSSQPAAASPP
jgi:CRP/FNR family transcriptional regulator, cyclic AMP receptor protein